MPFLTLLNPSAAIKGSRDPLGLVPIWSRFGREVIGNLTTATGSVRGFTTVLWGLDLARRISDEGGKDRMLEIFLKFEQLAGYCRLGINKDGDFRGTRKVAERLAGKGGVRLTADHDGMILEDQKVYGLWGLYLTATRDSGLLEGGNELSSAAAEHLEECSRERLGDHARAVRKGLLALLEPRESRLHLDGKHEPVAKAVATLLHPTLNARERRFYDRTLILGGPGDRTRGVQEAFAGLLDHHPPAAILELNDLRRWGQFALRRKDELGDRLAERLERIAHLESVLAPAAAAFGHLLTNATQPTVAGLARILKDEWGVKPGTINPAAVLNLRADIAAGSDDEQAAGWCRIAESLGTGDYGEAVKAMVEQNRLVMRSRKAAPWAEIEAGKLKINYREEGRVELPARRMLPSLLRNPYFIPSLVSVHRTVRGKHA